MEVAKSSQWTWRSPITVQVAAADVFGHTIDEQWEFSGDTGAPRILWATPVYGGKLEEDGYINAFIVDDNAGVDGSTLDAYVGSTLAIGGGVWPLHVYPPYNGALTDAYQETYLGQDGYHIVIHRTTPYGVGESYNLRVSVRDRLGRHMDEIWPLNTMPYVEVVFPTDGYENADPMGSIEFWVLDDGYLLQSTLDAYVSGTPAVYQGVILSPFDGA